MAELNELAEAILATVDSIDLEGIGETTLYTCPAGFECFITKVVIRNSTGTTDTVEISVGWNTGPADNVVANAAVVVTLTANYKALYAKTDAVRGVAAGTFKFDVNVVEDSVAVVSCDVFGYLVAV